MCCGRGRFAPEEEWEEYDADSDPWENESDQGDAWWRSCCRRDNWWCSRHRETIEDQARLRRAMELVRTRQHNGQPGASQDGIQPHPGGAAAAAASYAQPAARAQLQLGQLELERTRQHNGQPGSSQDGIQPPPGGDAAAAPYAQPAVPASAVPPHAHWLASIPDLWGSGWYQHVFAPQGPPAEWLATACQWHHPTYADGNTRDLSTVVGRYNTITTEKDLEGVLNAFEVGAFRTDRGVWYTLRDQIRRVFQSRQITIQRGRASCKYIFCTCINCGNYLYINQTGTALDRFPTPADEALRAHICTFFLWQMRAPNSQISYQV